jgi:hypothetical protein
MATSKDLGATIARNAASDLTGKVHYLAKVDSNGEIALAAAGTDVVLGVITEEAVADKPVTVQYDGQGKAIAGGSITAGARLTSDGSGKVVATTSAGDKVFGIALTAADSGDIVSFIFARGHVATS